MKIVAFDIETTALSALMGRVLCASFMPIYNAEPNELRVVPKPYSIRIDRKPWENPDDMIDDSLVLTAIREELKKYHCVVTWNGKQFDVPFVNARLMRNGEDRIEPQFHLDLMYYAGGVSMRVGSRKLVNVQKFMNIDNVKGKPEWEMWERVRIGNKKAMSKLVEYCENDVKGTAELYHKMLPAVKNLHR